MGEFTRYPIGSIIKITFNQPWCYGMMARIVGYGAVGSDHKIEFLRPYSPDEEVSLFSSYWMEEVSPLVLLALEAE